MKFKKENEKRKVRTYRASDKLYLKVEKKAEKEKTTPAKKIEELLYDYISR